MEDQNVTCPSGKAGYPNVKAAKTALNDCKRHRRFVQRRKEQSFYKCEMCEDFHLTSEPPGETRFT